MVYRHYVASARYDKFDIWKMMSREQHGDARVRPRDDPL